VKLSIPILFILLFNACSTIKVETDYSLDFSFGALSAFTIVHKDKTGDDTLTNTRIINALTKDLIAKGYKESEKSAANCYVLFHTDVHSKTEIDTDYRYVGIYPYSYGYPGMMIPATRIYTYDEAKLIVDIVDPVHNKIIWRGIATDRIKSHKTPEKRTAYINEVITSLLKTFPAKKRPL